MIGEIIRFHLLLVAIVLIGIPALYVEAWLTGLFL